MAFWNTVKPCLASKGFLTNKNIVIKLENEPVSGNSTLALLFNTYYIDIVKSTSAVSPPPNPLKIWETQNVNQKIIQHFCGKK